MDVDVSPNGKSLLFTLLGDIYKMPASGGKATRITKGLGLHLQPTWSPNGNYFAYISDETGSYQVHIRRVQNGQINLLHTGDFSYDGQPIRWLPDGRRILFDKKVYQIGSGKQIKSSQFDTINTGGNRFAKAVKLTLDKHWAIVATRYPSWSLVAVDQQGGEKKVLIPTLLDDEKKYRPAIPDLHFGISPDSKYVYIGYDGKIHRVTISNGENNIIPFTAEVKVDLAKLNKHNFRISQQPFKVNYVRSANKSTDGKHVVYSAMNKIYIKDLPNEEPRALIEQACNQYQPMYSSDGEWITWVTWSDKDGGALWRMRTTGKNPELLLSGKGQFQRPAWSPDDKRIAVLRDPLGPDDRDYFGNADLLLYDTESKKIDKIDSKVPLWNTVSFSSNGKELRYIGKNHTQFVGAKISDTTQIVLAEVKPSGAPIYYQQRSLSPDGEFFLYSLNEEIYLVKNEGGQKKSLLFDENDKIKRYRVGTGVDPYWSIGGKISWNYASKYYETSVTNVLTKIAPLSIDLSFTVSSAIGKGYLALTHSRLLTMNAGGQVIEDGTILIKDGRIQAVGKTSIVKIPSGAEVKNMQGKTVMPGIVDLHNHMRLQENVFLQQPWIYQANLAYGVTTVCDPSSSYSAFGYTELLKTGAMLGPRMFSVGRSINPVFNFSVNKLDQGKLIAEKRKTMEGTLIKQYALPNRGERQNLLLATDRAGLNITNEGDHNPIEQIGMLKDGSARIEHDPDWGDVYNDIIKLYAKSGTIITPCLQEAYGVNEGLLYFRKFWTATEWLPKFWPTNALTNFSNPSDTTGISDFVIPGKINKRIFNAGGHLGLGSHGNEPGIGAHNEMWALQMGGFTNSEVLRIATIEGAKALGVQADLGSLENGKIADLLILNKNPLDDIHYTREIRFVMKDGILYDGNTLDTVGPISRLSEPVNQFF